MLREEGMAKLKELYAEHSEIMKPHGYIMGGHGGHGCPFWPLMKDGSVAMSGGERKEVGWKCPDKDCKSTTPNLDASHPLDCGYVWATKLWWGASAEQRQSLCPPEVE